MVTQIETHKETQKTHPSTDAGQTGQTAYLCRAVRQMRSLLEREPARINADDIHAVKSVLYAAIEHVRFKTDQLTAVRELLSELMAVTALHADLREDERAAGLRIVNELTRRYGLRV